MSYAAEQKAQDRLATVIGGFAEIVRVGPAPGRPYYGPEIVISVADNGSDNGAEQITIRDLNTAISVLGMCVRLAMECEIHSISWRSIDGDRTGIFVDIEGSNVYARYDSLDRLVIDLGY